MSDERLTREQPAGQAAGISRRGAKVALLVLHSDPRPAGSIRGVPGAPGNGHAPHYYIAANGELVQLIPEGRQARHSGVARWKGRRRNIDRISLGIVLEHTPGAPYAPALLQALHELIEQLCSRHGLSADAVRGWVATTHDEQAEAGMLVPAALPEVPSLVLPAPDSLHVGTLGDEVDVPDVGDHVQCVPPPPPAALEQDSGLLLGPEDDPQAAQRFWMLLQRETYRHRGEGFRGDWAFHAHAARQTLGAPLARSSTRTGWVSFGGKQYGYQPFARDTLFNEIPKWSEVRSLNELLQGRLPASGLGRLLLEASCNAAGFPLVETFKTHHVALEQRLGPALGNNYALTLNGKEYGLQVFAGDTLYSEKPNWGVVFRLSETPPGPLRERLWQETYKVCGATYDAGSRFQQLAEREKLGTPLSDIYQVDFEGLVYQVQIFAHDTLYARPAGAPGRMSTLQRPPDFGGQAGESGASPDDALSNRRPVFGMLPIAGHPAIAQFYGYTKWSAGNGRHFYSQTQGRHSGIDFAVPVGTPLLAMHYGVVVGAGDPANKRDCPFGGCPPLTIIVRYGAVYAIYGHCSKIVVRKGQRVQPGDVLGQSGKLGSPHLHFELRPVPARLLENRDPAQPAENPGTAFNPLECFSPALNDYFSHALSKLGGSAHFCRDSLLQQEEIRFAGPVDNRPCLN